MINREIVASGGQPRHYGSGTAANNNDRASDGAAEDNGGASGVENNNGNSENNNGNSENNNRSIQELNNTTIGNNNISNNNTIDNNNTSEILYDYTDFEPVDALIGLFTSLSLIFALILAVNYLISLLSSKD